MARSNYQFKKRQKEIARMKKKEEKRQRKMNKNKISTEDNQEPSLNDDSAELFFDDVDLPPVNGEKK